MNDFERGVCAAVFLAIICLPASASTVYEAAVLADGPSLYWSFNSQDAATGKVPDLVGGLAADAMSPLKGPGVDYPAGWRATNDFNYGFNNLGDAFYVDYTTLKSCYYVPDSSKTASISSYAVEFWALRDTNNAKYLFAAPDANHTSIYTGYAGAGVVSMTGDNVNGAIEPRVNFAATSINAWYHYSVIVDAVADTTTTILNGGVPVTQSGALNPLNWDGTMILGSSYWGSGSQFWQGAIDEFAIYNLTDKTSNQIAALTGSLQTRYDLAAGDYPKSWPKIFDCTSCPEHYNTSYNYSPNMDWLGFQPLHPEITPMNQPGSWYDWNWERTLASYDRVVRENRPLSIFFGENTAPLTGLADREALSKSLNYLSGKGYPLSYVFMDFEPVHQSVANADVAEVVRQVRTHADPNINSARIGAYDYFTCDSIAYLYWPNPSPTNMTKTNNSYNSCGLNVSMPSCYPYAAYAAHADAGVFGSNVCPNTRAALFWTPLEKFSTAKRALPAGHELIPWICDFIPADSGWPYEGVTPPTKSDNAALLQHMRLRGADGYYIFKTCSEDEPEPYDNEEFRGDMGEAWTSLDWLFDDIVLEDVTFLNLTTDKHSGLSWSCAFSDNGAAILASNLGNTQIWFAMPNVAGYNDYLIDGFYINPGEHRMEFYQASSPWSPGDADRNGKVDADDAALLAENWLSGPGSSWSMGDFNYDGYVNENDAALLAANWMKGVGAASGSVPEPDTIMLLLISVMVVAGRSLTRK